ncbi:unnamed protein product [Onchocerca ochengi]|uniref:Uncharacterized protein n=1 Tax=Onchocerca ochengi TaxID=42157 RepID=A0A182ED94_ONCOC|nr:unnamed protein product [Onchocerca ochengi]
MNGLRLPAEELLQLSSRIPLSMLPLDMRESVVPNVCFVIIVVDGEHSGNGLVWHGEGQVAVIMGTKLFLDMAPASICDEFSINSCCCCFCSCSQRCDNRDNRRC